MTLRLPHLLGILSTVALASPSGCGGQAKAPAIPPPAAASAAPTSSDDGGFDSDGFDAGDETDGDLAAYIAAHYDKTETRIAMRDGTQLFTAIYTPKGRDTPAPIMLFRTPYGVAPYGPDELRTSLGPSETLARRGWIFAYQDVRGRFMSEGQFVNMTPHKATKTSDTAVDESSDTFDTVAWLVENVEGNNGRVGQWGISYPGFYAAAGMIDAHPALRAVSPQAPIADWFFDDFHHHGAFFLPHAFNFLAVFGQKRRGPTTEWPPRFEHGTTDGYAFFEELGPLSNANTRHFHGDIGFWNDLVAHPNYDAFWQARNLLPHLSNVAPAVMTVGGLFDAEDLYGPLQIYRSIEAKNPKSENMLVMGPWRHGGWARTSGQRLGNIDFGAKTSAFYQAEIEAPFFVHHLEDGPDPDLPEAYVFETGRNTWQAFDSWPPATQPTVLHFADDGALTTAAPATKRAFDGWTSDPDHPVPFTEAVSVGMTKEYMTDDQRFASRRPDVVTYQGPALTEAMTIAGPLTAKLFVSTSQRDADFVVKLIDVFPSDGRMKDEAGEEQAFSGYQMMVRSEVIRARFREGYEQAKPMTPGRPTVVELPLQDVLHTFEPGHRVMIQVQSTWFPLVDRNPQGWVDNIFEAKASDFVSAEHRLWRDAKHPSRIEFGTLPQG